MSDATQRIEVRTNLVNIRLDLIEAVVNVGLDLIEVVVHLIEAVVNVRLNFVEAAVQPFVVLLDRLRKVICRCRRGTRKWKSECEGGWSEEGG